MPKISLLIVAVAGLSLITAAYVWAGRYTVRGGGKTVIIVDRLTGAARQCSRINCRSLQEPPDFSAFANVPTN